jgi:acetyl-CoA/propionyl-CoA carboxylase carboxyl transferase subunit
VALGLVDEVIEPDATRGAISRALAGLPRRAGGHRNIPL